MSYNEDHERLSQAITAYNATQSILCACTEAHYDLLRRVYKVTVGGMTRTGTIAEVIAFLESFSDEKDPDSRKSYGEERYQKLKERLVKRATDKVYDRKPFDFAIYIFLDNHTVFPIFGSGEVPGFTPEDAENILELIEAWKITSEEVFEWNSKYDSVIIGKHPMVHFSGRPWCQIKPEIEALLKEYVKPTNV